ncbi:MAG: glycosyltransferase family 1 protein [Acidobacteria bacterium]|nr:glycosyltransferase family 1 protein [Acidobacteriota bacterium]
MIVRRVLVLESQTPFVHGGAEILVRELVIALRARGYEAETVSIPFRDDRRDELMAHTAIWRLLDLSHSIGQQIDLVIPTKFPTYFVRHPAKVAWLVHQHRAAYELCGTRFSNFGHTEQDVGLRKHLIELDTTMLRECAGLFSIARTVSERVEKYNGLTAEPLYHPPKLAKRLKAGDYGQYMLTVTRLERVKRVDLAIEAFRHVPPPMRLLVAGDGSARGEIEACVERLDMGDRVSLLGRVSDEELIDLYAGSRGMLFTPFHEDYGYVTLEAFLSRKPVVTTSDAGGPLEFIVDEVNGLVAEPSAEALATAINRLASDPRLAAQLGDAGYERARTITWDGVVERLIGAGERGAHPTTGR